MFKTENLIDVYGEQEVEQLQMCHGPEPDGGYPMEALHFLSRRAQIHAAEFQDGETPDEAQAQATAPDGVVTFKLAPVQATIVEVVD